MPSRLRARSRFGSDSTLTCHSLPNRAARPSRVSLWGTTLPFSQGEAFEFTFTAGFSEAHKPARGGLEGLAPPTSIRRASFARPRTRFLRRERSAAKTTGANNRYLTIFAPGNLRRDFSKNCKTCLSPSKRLTFYPSTLFRYRKPIRSK